MNKSMLTGVVLGAAIALAGGAIAYNVSTSAPGYADVVSVTPIKKTIKTPREQCRDVTVTHRKPVKDEHQILGTAVGAVAGGLLGNQIGGGRGKDIATIAGALGGGYAGNKAQEHIQEGNTYTTTERKCETVYDTSETVNGYTVKYRVGDRVEEVRMDHEPDSRLPLDKNGQPILDQKS